MCIRDSLRFPFTEACLAVVVEDVGDGPPGASDDEVVGIDELAPQPFGQQAADGGLARAHEAGEDDVVIDHAPIMPQLGL